MGIGHATRLTHGHSRKGQWSLTYRTWASLRTRCINKKSPGYRDYGARGITVCARWVSFENFLADMGERPSLSSSIERRNNDGDYEPGNCYWSTAERQAQNRRSTKLGLVAVCLIRHMARRGVSFHKLASAFDVSRPTIKRAVKYRCWKSLPWELL